MARRLSIISVVSICTALLLGGCKEGEEAEKSASGQDAQPSKPAAESAEPPPSGGATSGGPSKSREPTTNQAAKGAGSKLTLTGLIMTVPDGWRREQAKPGPMPPKAIFKLSAADGDQGGVAVRITHFPGMKGMDRQNIDRWVAQVRQPDGQPSTRDHATVTVKDLGAVKLTLVDITGSINTSMRGQGEAKPNQRLIAAIVDHPKGPHFVKASGGVECMREWEASILAFLESAQVN